MLARSFLLTAAVALVGLAFVPDCSSGPAQESPAVSRGGGPSDTTGVSSGQGGGGTAGGALAAGGAVGSGGAKASGAGGVTSEGSTVGGTAAGAGGKGTGGTAAGAGGKVGKGTGAATEADGGKSADGAFGMGGSKGGKSGAGDASSSPSPYKGIANSPAGQIAALGASWCYNWKSSPEASDCDDPYFVPMIWGGDSVATALSAIGKAGYSTVLGFNEPNKADQSNLSVDKAIALWPQLTSNPKIRVGSPAVSDDGRAWLEDFMSKAEAQGLRVDFIAMHWYGWNSGSCVASQLEGAVNWASKWKLPIWITEFGCMGSSNPDEKTVLSFFNAAIPMLDSHPLVERYAWYPWNKYNHLYDDNVVTALGQAFAAASSYRQ